MDYGFTDFLALFFTEIDHLPMNPLPQNSIIAP
jgi:hypothetical protein